MACSSMSYTPFTFYGLMFSMCLFCLPFFQLFYGVERSTLYRSARLGETRRTNSTMSIETLTYSNQHTIPNWRFLMPSKKKTRK